MPLPAVLPVRRILGGAMAVALIALPVVTSNAAGPRSGTLTAKHPVLTWTEGAAMNGAAPARRNAVCAVPAHPCDDFTLHLDRGKSTRTTLTIAVTPSGSNKMSIALYPPGCRSGPTDDACYTLFGSTATLISPANGMYLVRMSCDQCVAAGYHAVAKLTGLRAVRLPAVGDPSFGWRAQRLAASSNFGEPGISINARGHVIVNTFGPTVWISTDDGKSFGKPITVDPLCNAASGDADAVVSDDDTYYADNLCTAGPTNLSYSSQDGGKSWNASRAGLPVLPGGASDSDRQWFALDPKNPATIYLSYHDFEGPDIWLNKSTDHGQTWTQQSPITVGSSNFVDTSQGNTSARPLVDPTDPKTILVFYTSNRAAKSATAPPTNQDFDLNEIYLARSHDGGVTWTSTRVLDAGSVEGQDNTIAHEFSADAIDTAGNAYVAFSERRGNGTQTHVYLLVVPKGATRARPPVRVDSAGLGANVFPWVAAGDPGRVAVSWYGSRAQDNNDPQANWSEMVAVSTNALSARPSFRQSRVSGDRPMHSADICLAGTLCLVTGGNRNLADFQMVAADRCGRLQLVWTDDSTGSGYTVHARQTHGVRLRQQACP